MQQFPRRELDYLTAISAFFQGFEDYSRFQKPTYFF